MNDLRVRIPYHLGPALRTALEPMDGHEAIVFALVSHAATSSGLLLVVQDIISVPREAYLPAGRSGARWAGRFTVEVLQQALRRGAGVLMIHEHVFPGPVRLSRDDYGTALELLPRFGAIAPDRPHGSLVLGPDSAAAVVFCGGTVQHPGRVVVHCLDGLMFDTTRPHPGVADGTFDRQVPVFGERGQARITSAIVAVVGLGGGGSHVVQQLAHAGVGRILGIDEDRADRTNLHRMVGLSATDADARRPKVDVMREMVERIGLGTRFEPVPHMIPASAAIAALKEADVVVACLDNYKARSEVMECAWRYLIPYVDIGLIIDPAARDARPETAKWISGQVQVMVPGSWCLWCTDFLTEAKLLEETGGRDPSYFRSAGGHPQVVSLNGVLASQAVSEALFLITGYARPLSEGSKRLWFDGVSGTVQPVRATTKPACRCCREHLAAGDVQWAPVRS